MAEDLIVSKGKASDQCQRINCRNVATWAMPTKDRDGQVVWWRLCDEHRGVADEMGMQGIRPLGQIAEHDWGGNDDS